MSSTRQHQETKQENITALSDTTSVVEASASTYPQHSQAIRHSGKIGTHLLIQVVVRNAGELIGVLKK